MVPAAATARAALDAGALMVVGVIHDTINEVRALAEKAKRRDQLGHAISALDVAGKLTLRYLDITLGRKMRIDMNVRTQEDLPDYRSLPPEVRAKVDEALNAMDAHRRGRVVEVKRVDG